MAAATLAAALLVMSAGCTGGDDQPSEATSPLPSRSVGDTATLEAKPVPMQVDVAKVVGKRLGREQRERLERNLARVVGRYFDDAYLGGDYPRREFTGAFDTFSAGAARRARSDRDLLTNAATGAQVEAVVPKRKKVRLYVLAPRRNAVGLTARVRLVFVEERSEGADQRVTVAGRLLMSRKKSGAWQVFGYDVRRNASPVAGGER